MLLKSLIFLVNKYYFAESIRFAVFLMILSCATHTLALESAIELSKKFESQVDMRLSVPLEEQHFYAGLLIDALNRLEPDKWSSQYVVLVDRSPQVQALLLFWVSDTRKVEYIGASPVSTGRKGRVMYYETPTGVFDHRILNLDFRAEGTENEQGILGYGIKGMRVYDFGWVRARRTWKFGEGSMRLQMHATDPRYLEPRLGTAQSMGCEGVQNFV